MISLITFLLSCLLILFVVFKYNFKSKKKDLRGCHVIVNQHFYFVNLIYFPYLVYLFRLQEVQAVSVNVSL